MGTKGLLGYLGFLGIRVRRLAMPGLRIRVKSTGTPTSQASVTVSKCKGVVCAQSAESHHNGARAWHPGDASRHPHTHTCTSDGWLIHMCTTAVQCDTPTGAHAVRCEIDVSVSGGPSHLEDSCETAAKPL